MVTERTVTLYSCDVCQERYDHKDDAEKCERECKKQKRLEERRRRLAEQRKVLSQEIRLRIEQPCMVWDEIKLFAFKRYGFVIEFSKTPRVGFEDLAQVCNSHAAPIGKKTNWGGRDTNEPTSYFGWEGSVEGTIKGPKTKVEGRLEEPEFFGLFGRGFCRLPVMIEGFHTGSGTGGPHFNCQFSFFLDDFPKMKENYLNQKREEEKTEDEKRLEQRIMEKSW